MANGSDLDIPVRLSSASKVRLVSAYVRQRGESLGELLEKGVSVQQIVNDTLQQSLDRLKARDELPEVLILEAEAEATRIEAKRAAVAPIPAGQ